MYIKLELLTDIKSMLS